MNSSKAGKKATAALSRFFLSTEQKEALEKLDLVEPKDVLFRTALDLRELLNVPLDSAIQIRHAICCGLFDARTDTHTALSLLNAHKKSPWLISTGVDTLNECLRGGWQLGAISEIAGQQGSGRTSLCLHTVVQAVLPIGYGGDGASAYFVDSEAAFSYDALAAELTARLGSSHPDVLKQCMEKVCVVQIHTPQKLEELLKTIDNELITRKAKVLVIDCLAALARRGFNANNTAERQAFLSRVSSRVRTISEAVGIAALVTNTAGKEGDPTSVSLGTLWSHCVNTRVLLSQTDETIREFTIVKSPRVPFAKGVLPISSAATGTAGFEENTATFSSQVVGFYDDDE